MAEKRSRRDFLGIFRKNPRASNARTRSPSRARPNTRMVGRRVFLKSVGVSMLGSHFALERLFRKAYAQEPPAVKKKPLKSGSSFDFIFGRHGKDDIGYLRDQLEKARKEGKPYKILIGEDMDILVSKRKGREESNNNILARARKDPVFKRGFLANVKKAIRGSEKDLVVLGDFISKETRPRVIDAYLMERSRIRSYIFGLKKTELMVEYNLRYKSAEEYTANELEENEKILESALEHQNIYLESKSKGDYKTAVRSFALYLHKRNKKIIETLHKVEVELESHYSGENFRAAILLGYGHFGVFSGFDKSTGSRVRAPVVKKDYKFEGDNFEMQLIDDAIALEKQGLEAINNY